MKIAFIVPPEVEILDLAGPVQVFTEAKDYGLDITMEFYSFRHDIKSKPGLAFGEIKDYRLARLADGDYLFIPGMDFPYIESISFKLEREFFQWVRLQSETNVQVCSVCNGAFILGEAGLLNGISCTTHWRRIKQLQERFPMAKVVDDILYVKERNIYSSAGISAGIDLALGILEDIKGAQFTNIIARELVVYQRRSHDQKQLSVYIDYRNHINPRIHLVQDYLANNLEKQISIEQLASIAAMSARNLTRVFKSKAGITIWEYLTRLRVEKASVLRNDPSKTVEAIAALCGFKSSRQLLRILKQTNSENPQN